MIKVNLEKEFQSKVANAEKQYVDPISEANKLIENGNAEDRQIIKAFAPKSLEQEIIKEKTKVLDRQALKESNGGYGIYNYSEIEDLCIKYRLRFIDSKMYIGSVPMSVVQEIKKYFDSKGVGTGNYHLDQMYILAPKEMFNLKERTKSQGFVSRLVNPDPVLFCKLTGEANKYVLLKKWGSDFTIMRRVLGFIMKSRRRLIPILAVVLSVLYWAFLSKYIWIADDYWWKKVCMIAATGAITGLSVVISGLPFKFDEDKEETDECWNKEYNTLL